MRLLKFIFLLTICLKLNAQVGVNITNANNSSMLDVFSTNKGLLIPRVSLNSTTNNLLPINSPAPGILVWNTNSSMINGAGVGYYYYNGSIWDRFLIRNSLDQQYDQGGNGQGRIIVADAGAVRIDGTDGFMITGTFSSGALIDSDISGAGTRMFFNPRKAAFRAGSVTGTNFNDGFMGNYSFATGYDNRVDGTRTFGANRNNSTSTQNNSVIGSSNQTNNDNSFSSGFSTRAGGNNAFSSGSTTQSFGFHSFANGLESRSSTMNEVAVGHYPLIATKVNSSGIIGADSQSAFYSADRGFVIGNGTSILRHNAFEVWKNGRVIINGNYSLPTTDGTNKQRLTTNGTGTVAWAGNVGITQIPLYADDIGTTLSSTTLTDVLSVDAGLIPSNFVASGNVRVKLVIRYTSLTGTPSFRLRVHNGTTQSTPITTGSVWTYTDLTLPALGGVGGIIESEWRNWAAGTSVYEAHLSGLMASAGQTITIQNCYLLISPQ